MSIKGIIRALEPGGLIVELGCWLSRGRFCTAEPACPKATDSTEFDMVPHCRLRESGNS